MADEKLRYIIEVDTKNGVIDIRNFKNEIVETADSAKILNTEVKNLKEGKDGKGGMQGLTTATGGASAAALELGRVISDAPYGIRGMANNVSQLASNILFMSQQTDKATGAAIGFGGAIKGVWAALKGPLGVLLAVQVVISAIDYFAGSTKKAKKEVEELDKSLAEVQGTISVNSTKLLAYVEAYKESEKGTRQQTNALKELKKYGIDPAVEGWENLVEAQLKLIGLQAMEGYIKKMLSDTVVQYEMATDKMVDLTTKLDTELEELTKAGYDPSEAAGMAQVGATASAGGATLAAASAADVFAEYFKLEKQLKEVTKARIPLMEKRNGLEDRLKGIIKDILSLSKIMAKSDDDNNKALSEYKQKQLDLSSELEKYRQRELDSIDVSEEERLRREYDASRRAVEAKRQEFKDKEDDRLDARLKEIEDSRLLEEEKDALRRAAYDQYNEAQIKANEDMLSVMLQMNVSYYTELGKIRREDTKKAKEEAKKLYEALKQNDIDYTEFNGIQKIEQATNELDRIKAEEAANAMLTQKKIGYLEKEILAQWGNYAAQQEIGNEIDLLRQEQALYEEELDRRSAEAKIAIANQVADSLIEVLGEGSSAAKGVAIAQTIWNTSQAVVAALGAAPYGPWNIAQAAAVGAMGYAQVRKIMETKSPYEKANAAQQRAAANTGGGSAFNPNFNVVGSSGTNQLASTVAGQLGGPTRAYVVYGDITTAEELESNAVQSAGL